MSAHRGRAQGDLPILPVMGIPRISVEEREQLRQDLKKSEALRADIRAMLARGKDQDLLTIWETVEALDVTIARQIRKLTPQ